MSAFETVSFYSRGEKKKRNALPRPQPSPDPHLAPACGDLVNRSNRCQPRAARGSRGSRFCISTCLSRQGGSAGKGTALKTGSDADLVVFPSSIKSFTSQVAERTSVINEIRHQLEACQQEKNFEVKFEISKRTAPRVLSFSLKSEDLSESVDFDVLPAFNVLGETPRPLAPQRLEEEGGCVNDGGRRGEEKPRGLVMGHVSTAPSQWHYDGRTEVPRFLFHGFAFRSFCSLRSPAVRKH